MKCPSCQFENPESARYCSGCGNALQLVCPKCERSNPPGSSFCNHCGHRLEEKREKPFSASEAARKQVTVLFSDLSGYTRLTEKLDPEEAKEIMSRIFGQIAQVVTNYEGFIEKFIGDAVVALFGVPKAHEDDPIRAIRAAREIHDLVRALSPEIEQRTGYPASMHSGINTGLVVTGDVDIKKGTHGVSGEAITLASRLCDHAKSNEILVTPDTYRRAEGNFTFEALEHMEFKGRAEPVTAYKVVSLREIPAAAPRFSGLRADLIGRKAELAQLEEAVQRLREGKGTIVSLCGDPGTGKSRLVQEFRTNLDGDHIQWLEGHAYSYAQNIPYFPLINLLNRAWQIEEGDPPEIVREKLASRINLLLEKRGDIVAYIGSLYALSYPETEGKSPEDWKSRLRDAVQTILSALTRNGPTIICLEDFHWADPSSLDLLRFLLSEFRYPVLFLFVYRLPFSPFTTHELSAAGRSYQEIRLQDLSPSETQDMMESLLSSKDVPLELKRFVQLKVEGNPFYLEEVMNSLIESGALIRDDGSWGLTRSLGESDIPPTVEGVITARIDRLEPDVKRVLQEASVIGRVFPYEILERTSREPANLEQSLEHLERLDLIRIRALHPEVEYIFKHALTQEVVYRGLLKKERQSVHERIALVMERLFGDRLPDFYETLAFHFKQGQSVHKAVEYLLKSGEKSLKKYAVEESDRYFQEAHDLLVEQPGEKQAENELLVDLLIKWSFVFHYRGDFRGLTDLLIRHKGLAIASGDRARLGMYYTLLGLALYETEKIQDAYQHLREALVLGEETGDRRVIGYACSWLAWVCPELGLFRDSIDFGERAKEIAATLASEDYLFFNTVGGMGLSYYYSGDRRKALEIGQLLLRYGEKQESIRSQTLGHFVIGCSHLIAGDYDSAVKSLERSTQVSLDPWYSHFPSLLIGLSFFSLGQFQKAKEVLIKVREHSQLFGSTLIGTPARSLLAVIDITEGHLAKGLHTLEAIQKEHLSNDRKYIYAVGEYLIGKIYAQLGTAPLGTGSQASFPVMRNLGFLLKNLPFARRKAEERFKKSLALAEEIGAHSVAGTASLDLGLLYQFMGKKVQSRDCLEKARQHLEYCEADSLLRQAAAALRSP
jgi:class 3 adenylate cyclase/tetratricopeptide (TPR) repeat protein